VNSSSAALREFRFPDDYDEVRQFWEGVEKGIHVGASDAPLKFKKRFNATPIYFWLPSWITRSVGTVIGGFDGRRGMIYHLAVASALRGQGLGSRLMNEVEARLRTKGCLKCYLIVLRDNKEAVNFYEGLGWGLMEQVLLFGKELK